MSKRQQKAKMMKPETVEGINPAVDVAQSIQRGEIPSTAEAAQVLQKSEKSLDELLVSAEDERQRQLVRDTQSAMGAAKELIESKNLGSKLQSIYKETTLASQSGEEFPGAVGLTEEDKRVIREIRQRFMESSIIGRDLLRMIIMNPQFRAAMLGMLNLAYDVFYQVGEAVAEEQPPKGASASKRAKKAASSATKAMQGKRTEGQRRELSNRLKDTLKQIRDNELYQRGVRNLFVLADLIKVSASKIEEKAEEMEVEVTTEPHTKKALEETKALAEEFLPGDKTLDPLLDKLKALVIAIKNDAPLAEHLRAWRNYIETSLKNPAKLAEDSYIQEGEKLAEDALNFNSSTDLNAAAKEAFDEWKDVFENFQQDEQLNTLNLTLKKLMTDITKRDEQGRTSLDLQAIARFRPIVVELLKKNMEQIPLPDVKGEDETYQWKAWNLVASGSDILPDYISIESSTKSEAAIKDTSRPSWLQGNLIITVQNIRTKLENVQFWYNRKVFPSGEDQGYMDIDVAGGINVVIKLILEADDTKSGLLFTGGSVYCRADDVRVKVRDTKHDFLYNLFSGSWAGPIKDNIEKFVAEKLAGAIQDFREAANERVREFQKSGISAAIPEVIKQQFTA